MDLRDRSQYAECEDSSLLCHTGCYSDGALGGRVEYYLNKRFDWYHASIHFWLKQGVAAQTTLAPLKRSYHLNRWGSPLLSLVRCKEEMSLLNWVCLFKFTEFPQATTVLNTYYWSGKPGRGRHNSEEEQYKRHQRFLPTWQSHICTTILDILN
jgi:hypothetical protein